MLQNQTRELRRLLGKKTLEAEILREALDATTGPKAAAALAVLTEGRLQGRPAARYSASPGPNIAELDKAPIDKPRPGRPAQPDEAAMPSYGYRRVWAVLRRAAIMEARPAPNHKQVYRVMKAHGSAPAPRRRR